MQEVQVEITPSQAYYKLDGNQVSGHVAVTLVGMDLPLLSHLQVSLEGKETFIFHSQDPNRTNIQHQSKFYQSEVSLIAHFPAGTGGLKQGRHVFQFHIQLQDDGKRPPSLNLNQEQINDPQGLGKGLLTLQTKYELKLRGFARVGNTQATVIRADQCIVMLKPMIVDKSVVRENFLEMARAEVQVMLPAKQLQSAGISEFFVEAESDHYSIESPIPIKTLIDNRLCKQAATSFTAKLVRCIKFRVDLGTGQECIVKSTLASYSSGPIAAHKKVDMSFELNAGDNSKALHDKLQAKLGEMTKLEELFSQMQILPTCQSQNYLVYYMLEAKLNHNKQSQPIQLDFEVQMTSPKSVKTLLQGFHTQIA